MGDPLALIAQSALLIYISCGAMLTKVARISDFPIRNDCSVKSHVVLTSRSNWMEGTSSPRSHRMLETSCFTATSTHTPARLQGSTSLDRYIPLDKEPCNAPNLRRIVEDCSSSSTSARRTSRASRWSRPCRRSFFERIPANAEREVRIGETVSSLCGVNTAHDYVWPSDLTY